MSTSSSKTQFYGAASIDGFLSASDDNLDWLMQFGDVPPSYTGFIAQIGALAMGAATYEWVLAHHVRPNSPSPQPWPYEQPTWVFTHRKLPPVPGAEIHFVSGDVRPVHTAMRERAGDKNLWLVGGGELIGQFCDHGLLDELILQIAPVTLRTGKPLLPRSIITPALKLVSVQQFGAFAELTYEFPKGNSK